MKKFMRNVQPEQEFLLLRTGCRYKFLRRDYSTPSGTRHVCMYLGPEPRHKDQRLTTLHHSCHVWVFEVGGGGQGVKRNGADMTASWWEVGITVGCLLAVAWWASAADFDEKNKDDK